MRKRLLLVGITETHIANALRRARALDAELLLADSAVELARFASLIGLADRLIPIDYRQPEEVCNLVGDLRRSPGLHAAFTFKEEALLPVALAQAAHGLAGNPPDVVASCIDKERTHRLLTAAGLPGPRSALCQNVDEVVRFASGTDGHLMLKPHNLQGSVGVVEVRPGDDVARAVETCLDSCRDPVLLAQQFITAPEMSLEGLVYRGRPILLTVTEKEFFPGTFVESGHTCPGGQLSDYPAYEELLRTVVAALGIVSGPLHIEFYLTPAGPVVGEVHTRYGGGALPTLIELATAFDVHTPIFAELLDRPLDVDRQPWRWTARVAATRFLHPPAGVLRHVTGVAGATIPDVVELHVPWASGERIPEIRSSSDRKGWAILSGATRDEVDSAATAVRHRVHFSVDAPL